MCNEISLSAVLSEKFVLWKPRGCKATLITKLREGMMSPSLDSLVLSKLNKILCNTPSANSAHDMLVSRFEGKFKVATSAHVQRPRAHSEKLEDPWSAKPTFCKKKKTVFNALLIHFLNQTQQWHFLNQSPCLQLMPFSKRRVAIALSPKFLWNNSWNIPEGCSAMRRGSIPNHMDYMNKLQKLI